MSNTFWAVFFGASLGLFSVNIITAAIDDFRRTKRNKQLRLLLDQLEDAEFEDDE
jgi:hypothetical protein